MHGYVVRSGSERYPLVKNSPVCLYGKGCRDYILADGWEEFGELECFDLELCRFRPLRQSLRGLLPPGEIQHNRAQCRELKCSHRRVCIGWNGQRITGYVPVNAARRHLSQFRHDGHCSIIMGRAINTGFGERNPLSHNQKPYESKHSGQQWAT